LRGWSELIFGATTNGPSAMFFECCTILLGVLFLAGANFLTKRDKLILGAILLPPILLIFYLATQPHLSYYPIAKITVTILPFLIGLVFVPQSRLAANRQDRRLGGLKNLFCAMIVGGAAAGSVWYYSEVLNDGGLLRIFRRPAFLNVCRELEGMKNKRVLVFETNPMLSAWLCYHARQNRVYFDGRAISDSPVPSSLPFSKVPDLENVDFVATRDRVVNLRAPVVSCLSSVDDTLGEDRGADHPRYWLGPPARLRFLAFRAMLATLTMRLTPGPKAAMFPVNYFLTDARGHVLQDEIQGKAPQVLGMNLSRGLSYLELSVKEKYGDPSAPLSFPILASLDQVEITETDLKTGIQQDN
jgi:hypothetical protein